MKWSWLTLKVSTAMRKKHYDEDEEFAERARNYVVKLQSGDEYFREMWRKTGRHHHDAEPDHLRSSQRDADP